MLCNILTYKANSLVTKKMTCCEYRPSPSEIERFDHGRQLMMVVDNYEPKYFSFGESLKASADAQFNSIRYLYIGRNETMSEGFVGCISRVEFDEIIPLKLLFQEDPLSNIQGLVQ